MGLGLSAIPAPRPAHPPPPPRHRRTPRSTQALKHQSHPGTLKMRAVVVALADLGRCARMQYHARALADADVDVDLVGLAGTPLSRLVTDEPRIHVHRLKPAMSRFHGMPIGYSGFATGDALRVGF